MNDAYWKSLEVAKLRCEIFLLRDQADTAWHEANGISAGSGCTPFIAEAKGQENRLKNAMAKFIEIAGIDKLLELKIRHLTWNRYPCCDRCGQRVPRDRDIKDFD